MDESDKEVPTKVEKQEVIEKYNQQQKEQYAKRQEKKFDRLAKYSLDKDNKRLYETRRGDWKNVVENNQKNDIMESDLSVFKYKLRNDKDIDKEYYDGLKEKFTHGSKDAKSLFVKYASGETIETSSFEGVAHFDRKTKKISMNYRVDKNNPRGIGVTWFHEHGHLIDDALETVSDDKRFRELLYYDLFQYRVTYGKEHNLKTYDKVDRAISNELQDLHKHSAISDLFDGITKGNIKGCASHTIEYWDNQKNVTAEAFAHMFEAQFDKVRYQEMKKYFPMSLDYFEKKLKEVAK